MERGGGSDREWRSCYFLLPSLCCSLELRDEKKKWTKKKECALQPLAARHSPKFFSHKSCDAAIIECAQQQKKQRRSGAKKKVRRSALPHFITFTPTTHRITAERATSNTQSMLGSSSSS